MREASPEIETAPVLGALQLLKRKTGEVASYIALNADRATLGRERDCDIRLYFPDVSKLHAEIVFNDESGAANLVVHGNNGLIYTPAGGAPVKLVPPAVATLGDGDTFQIRQKLFRFIYGDSAASNGYQSPAKPAFESPAKRRQSHRLSIVPQGKRFAPSPAKMRPLAPTPGRSGLSKEVEIEEDPNEPLIFDELVDVAEGDEGDKVYLEKREEEAEPIYNHPFMTPQQPKRRAELRNTSAVPRTRTLTFAIPDKSALVRDEVQSDSNSEEEQMEDEGIDDEVPANDAHSAEESEEESESQEEEPPMPASPRTPRSIPLPPPSDTPYSGPMGSPRRPIVTPRSGYATNRAAPDSLRKALLLRSARKAYEASLPSAGIEDEIANGHIEVRRRRSVGRKTLSPPKAASDSDSSEASSDEEDEDKENAPQQLRWVYENGQADMSQFDDSDSDRESFDMDWSIPGQGVIDFHGSREVNSASESEEYVSEDDVDGHGGEYEYKNEAPHGDPQAVTAEESFEEQSESESGSEASEGELSTDELVDNGEQMVEVDEVGDISSDIDDEVDRSLMLSPEEMDERKSPSPILPSRFYTPQPERKVYGGARMSLAGIGGHSMRFVEQRSPTSSTLQTEAQTEAQPEAREPPTPGRLGKPVRVVYKSPAAKRAAEEGREFDDEDDEDDDEVSSEEQAAVAATPLKSTVPATPLKTPGVPATPLRTPGTGLTKEQREQLGTPLALPSAPAESFRDSVPRIQPTPRRGSSFLEALRQSVQNSAKKAHDRGVSFDVPETPSRQPKSASTPALGSTRRRQANTPRVESIDEGESESLPPTPTHADATQADAAAQDLVEKAEAALDADMAPTPQQQARARRRSLPSPSLSGLRDMLKPPKVPKTPSMAGVRDLFKTPKAAQTPALDGVREMMREPKHAKTPSFAGMREMFRTQAVQSTPAMTGVREMFAEPVGQATPGMEGVAEMFPEVIAEPEQAREGNEEEAEHEEQAQEKDEEQDEQAQENEDEGEVNGESEAEPHTEPSAPTSPEKTSKKPARSKVPTRSIPARTTRASSRSRSESAAPEGPESAEVEAEAASEPAPAKPTRARRTKDDPPKSTEAKDEPASAPTRARLRGKASTEDAPSLPSRRAVSAPTRRVTRSRTAEPDEPAEPAEGEEREAHSAPTRRSRRVLGEAEQRKVSASTASTSTSTSTSASASASGTGAKTVARKASAAKVKKDDPTPATTKRSGPAAKTASKAKTAVAAGSTEDKENSATPDPEPKRRVAKKASASALPVRVTRSRKA